MQLLFDILQQKTQLVCVFVSLQADNLRKMKQLHMNHLPELHLLQIEE